MASIFMSILSFGTALFALTIGSTPGTSSPSSAPTNATYTNPTLNTVGADPWVIRYEDYYYMTYTTNDNITILRSSILTDWNNADVKLAFLPPASTSYSYDLWAPELHHIDSKWYIIFTADVDPDSPHPDQDMLCDYSCPAVNHRMFVLESSGSHPWTSNYTLASNLDTYDQFAIDGTYFTPPGSTSLHHIYSCWFSTYQSWPSNLCVSSMSSPLNISTSLASRLTLSSPTNPWEKTPYNRTVNDRLSSNEGPQQLINPLTNQTFIIYSAARSDNANYCLGLIEYLGPDPLLASSWRKNNASCIFAQNPAEQVYGVGHASFTTSPDGSENWIVYHGMEDPSNGWSARTIRAQKFEFDGVTGWPIFPKPGIGPFEVPSGQA